MAKEELYIIESRKVGYNDNFNEMQRQLFDDGYIWNNGDATIIEDRHHRPFYIQLWSDKTITHSQNIYSIK